MKRPELDKIYEKVFPLSYVIHHKDEFDVDRTYQREEVWTLDMKQYLIDSILKRYDISRIYVRIEERKYWIVDGQQRLNAIWEFAENKFPLNPKYSGELGGKYYKDLPLDIKESLNVYNIVFVFLRDFNDEEIRDVFRRINTSIPLNTAERLNAYPGNIVLTMRKLSEHRFFRDITTLRPTRYRYYHIAAQLLLLEKRGITDIAPRYLYEFFETERNLDTDAPTFKKINQVLNYLTVAFASQTMELGEPGWIITTYLLTSYLLDNYAMKGREGTLKDFLIKFYQDVRNSSELGDKELIHFRLAISRGTTSKKNIELRHKVILKRFLIYAKDLVPLDPKRDFTEEEKIAVFRRDGGVCQARLPSGETHGKALSMSNFHVHHIKPHSEGGMTTLENAMLVCEECHKRLHGSN